MGQVLVAHATVDGDRSFVTLEDRGGTPWGLGQLGFRVTWSNLKSITVPKYRQKSIGPLIVEGISKSPDSIRMVEYYAALKKDVYTIHPNTEDPHCANAEQKKPDTKECCHAYVVQVTSQTSQNGVLNHSLPGSWGLSCAL